jgi:hypothetical protein
MSEHLRNLETLAREIPLAKRKDLGEVFAQLGAELGLAQDQLNHLTWPTPAWPNRGESSKSRDDALRYLVDFSYGETPDHRSFVATFEQVRKFLNYTKGSCKVAFGSNKGVVDRTQRPTRLGPCKIIRLPTELDLAEHPTAVLFQVKLDEAGDGRTRVELTASGRKRVVPKHGNRY